MSQSFPKIPNPYDVLAKHHLRAKKSLGQNFLTDAMMPYRIAIAGGATETQNVFEIGSGLGTLTHALAYRAQKVLAIEYDPELYPIAQAELQYASNTSIIHQDVRDVNWAEIAKELGEDFLIYGNIPYYLSSFIILSVLGGIPHWKRACFLVQLEFAERICAAPGENGCGVLSAFTHLLTYPTLMFEVDAKSFTPAPKIQSAVLVLERRDQPAFDVGQMVFFKRVVRTLFSQRRKMARKVLQSLVPTAEELLIKSGLDPQKRGEKYTLEELARLSRFYGEWLQAQGPNSITDLQQIDQNEFSLSEIEDIDS
jgi:16S rRNA (adenine1518-N6/adenine1519-N6)-dimethyltransferase